MAQSNILTPDHILQAYRLGLFPMAETRYSPDLHWVDPEFRGVIPLDEFHIARSLRKKLQRTDYTVTINQDLTGIMQACAARPETWMNDTIFGLYHELHVDGFVHSLEVRHTSGALAGGLYGLAIGGAFFGESMFSHARDGSKIALAWLVHRLRYGGFMLLDTQFITPHLASLGGVEIPHQAYHEKLRSALACSAQFAPNSYKPQHQDIADMRPSI